jgi:hypothetical protein
MEQRTAAGGVRHPSFVIPHRATNLGAAEPAKDAPPELALTELPPIVEILSVGVEGKLVVLRYTDFVQFAARALPVPAPDVAAVLDHSDEHAFAILALSDYQSHIRKLRITGNIDEQHYLSKYPDIAAAVRAGQLTSGTYHYIIQGYFERREVKF